MSLREKKERLFVKIRKQDHQAYFKKIRTSLQMNQDNKQIPNASELQKIQPEEILEAIRCFKKQQQSLNFGMINQYVLASSKPFSQAICIELANVVLDSHRTNGNAIAALAHTLSKCQQANFLNCINQLSAKILQLIDENVFGDNKIKNGQAIAYLIFNLLYFSQNKEDYYYLPKYYAHFANSYGYFDRALLLVIHASSVCRGLLPSSIFVQNMLNSEVDYTKLQVLDFKIICEFVQNYVCFDLNKFLYIDLMKWIDKRLKQKKFPLSLKSLLLKIFSTVICYDFVEEYTNQVDDINTQVVQEIIQIARFGSLQSKIEALKCICKFIDILDPDRIQTYLQNSAIFEVIMYSLQLSIEPEGQFNLLRTLAIIFVLNHKYYTIATRLGLKPLLYRFFNSKVVKVARLAEQIMDAFQNYN